jgi:hypothetical protein
MMPVWICIRAGVFIAGTEWCGNRMFAMEREHQTSNAEHASPLYPEAPHPSPLLLWGGEGDGPRGSRGSWVQCANSFGEFSPGPMTRSLPLARPSRASAFGRIPFAASRAAQVPRGEGETVSRFPESGCSVTQSSDSFLSASLRRRLRGMVGPDRFFEYQGMTFLVFETN